MFEPQDLPGRYGKVVKAIDRILSAIDCTAVIGGGWAVWRHGYVGRLTQDIDIVLPTSRLEEFLRVAAVSGFQVTSSVGGHWPKLCHKDTDISVDILPEGGRPGTAARPAPTTIPHPVRLGGEGSRLRYTDLQGLVELKLAAGRLRDENDVIELIRANPGRIASLQEHLLAVHPDYVAALDRLLVRAHEEDQQAP